MRSEWTACAAVALLAISFAVAAADPPESLSTERSAALAQIGARLFRDKRLSVDGTVSCSSCHQSDNSFADGKRTASGLFARTLTRNTPSLLNVRDESSLFWDGRASTLEEQALLPLLSPVEHGLRSEAAVLQIVQRDADYVTAFRNARSSPSDDLSISDIASALAAFERTLVAGKSPFDRYEYQGDRRALSDAAVRGLELFRGRGGCAACHLIGGQSAALTDRLFHPAPTLLPTSVSEHLGELAARVVALRTRGATAELNTLIATDAGIAALGHFVVTLDPKDIGRFKTPSLRNVALTGPYMHDGSVASLPEAIELELYSRTGSRYPLVLTQDEQQDLLETVRAFSSR